jgi:hypothetical protein
VDDAGLALMQCVVDLSSFFRALMTNRVQLPGRLLNSGSNGRQ